MICYESGKEPRIVNHLNHFNQKFQLSTIFLTFSIRLMDMNSPKTPADSSQRLLSLDFMRGFIMVLLALESVRLYEELSYASRDSMMHVFVQQFFHHPWHGLRFWDLIQPGFMYIAGVSMALSLHKQAIAGMTWKEMFLKILKRCGLLFFWGVLDYLVTPHGLQLDFSDVLTQLSFTTLIAFLIFRWSVTAQIFVCIGLLLLREVLYRYTDIPGFDQPFTNQHNFGNYMELILVKRINPEGWVSINWIPTAVHTIAGALTGKLLLSGNKKIKIMLIWGAICFMIGYGLDITGITPIIKRIATSSFTLVSLGYVLFGLTACYWWIDILDHKKYLKFFTIVGMNSIFIYLFFEIVGSRWFNDYISAITNGLMRLVNIPSLPSAIISSLCVFGLEWGLCYFLYRKKIFFRV
jgi:predicted acyltransferase